MEPGAEGDGAGCGGRMARGGRLDGPGRLRSKSFISANKGFFALKAKRRSRAEVSKAKPEIRFSENICKIIDIFFLVLYIRAEVSMTATRYA